MKRICFLVLLMGTISMTACASSQNIQKSDHFDGEKFFNPYARFSTGFTDQIKLMYEMATGKKWVKPPPQEKKHSLPAQPQGNEIKVTFVNHASFIIQSADFVILTDPVWSKRVSPVKWAGPARYIEPGIALEDLRQVDLVLVSHNHYDHMDLDTLKILKSKFDPLFIVPIGDKGLFETEGLSKVQELDWWQEAVTPKELKITFAPTQHFSSRGLFDRNKSLWGSYMIETRGKKIYFGGDAGYSPHYKEIEQRLGAPDLSLLPIGAYEPYWFMGVIHMNPDDAVKAHLDLKSKKSIGMHFGTFKLTLEAIDQPVKDLEASKAARGVKADSFITIGAGESEQI